MIRQRLKTLKEFVRGICNNIERANIEKSKRSEYDSTNNRDSEKNSIYFIKSDFLFFSDNSDYTDFDISKNDLFLNEPKTFYRRNIYRSVSYIKDLDFAGLLPLISEPRNIKQTAGIFAKKLSRFKTTKFRRRKARIKSLNKKTVRNITEFIFRDTISYNIKTRVQRVFRSLRKFSGIVSFPRFDSTVVFLFLSATDINVLPLVNNIVQIIRRIYNLEIITKLQ